MISHISYSSSGGAGNIARQLVNEQKKMGFDSSLHTVSHRSVAEEPLKHPVLATTAFVDQFLLGSTSELLTPLRSKFSLVPSQDFWSSELIHLHWLPGALSDSVVANLVATGRKVVWTMHDYRPITGGCHYVQGCNQFQSGCKSCPQTRRFFRGIISASVGRKVSALSSSSLTLVSPSLGLAAAARQSLVAQNMRVEYIPNPVAPELLERSSVINKEWSAPRHFIFVAANVEEHRKGLEPLLGWWEKFRSVGQKLTLVGRHSEKYTNPGKGVQGLGTRNRQEIAALFEEADILVFASSEDNAPGVIAEGVAAGLPIFVLGEEMRAWLWQEGTPLISEEQIKSGSSVKTYFDDAYFLARNLFLQKRNPRLVAKSYLDLYGSMTA